jgi:hypothetical protein
MNATNNGIPTSTISLDATTDFSWSTGPLSVNTIGAVLANKINNLPAYTTDGWSATYGGGILTLTEKGSFRTDALQPQVSSVVISTTDGTQGGGGVIAGGGGGAQTNTLDTSFIDETTTFWGGVLGADKLDFTSYGVVAVFLDNTFLPATITDTSWTITNGGSAYDEDGSSHITAGVPTPGPGFGVNAINDGIVSGTYTGGAKYITIRQLDTTASKNATGVYEIRLWQDDKESSTSWGTADAYTVNHKDGDLGLIGIVDFGQTLNANEFTTTSGFEVLF